MIIVPPMFTVPKALNVVPSPLNRVPCITAFGTRFPPKFAYPSKVHRYKPFTMPTLQTCGSGAGPALPDVPTAITATRQTNAQVKARELIIVLVNFVFIVIVSLSVWVFLVLAFFEPLIVRNHFGPFTFSSPDYGQKVSGNFAAPPHHELKRGCACGKRLATGAVALQRIFVKKAYAHAGVDVDLGNKLKRQIHSLVRHTHGPQVLGKIGGFGGLFRANFPGMRDPVLVSSTDSVGTKLKIAFALNKHDTVGEDLVNHCVNDIAVIGARPLFFLDYIGCEKLQPRMFDQLLRGLARACRAARCALIGGETAQLGDMYRKGEYDLVGCIVGIVDRAKMIDGQKIKPGDVILGMPSNGLHTNGYSLARKILFEKMKLKPSSRLPGSTSTVGAELLRVHKNYQPLLAKIPNGMIKGLAHITGGGLIDNLPRTLPGNCDAIIETKSWRMPRLFQILQENGNIDLQEMYQVFNMGIGMVAVVSERDARRATLILKAKRIGQITHGNGRVRLKF